MITLFVWLVLCHNKGSVVFQRDTGEGQFRIIVTVRDKTKDNGI